MAKKQVTIPIFVPHLGCPHSCAFCNQWAVSGAEKEASPEDVRETAEKYLSTVKSSVTRTELAFFGGSFTAVDPELQEALLRAAQPYIKSGKIHSIRLSTRPDCLTDEGLAMLKSYGTETVELGVQSFVNRILDAAGRDHTAEEAVRGCRMVKDAGLKLVIQLMPGLPLDTEETSMYSAETAAGLIPDGVRLYPTVVMNNTGLEKMYLNGSFTPLSLEEAVKRVKKMYLLFRAAGIPVIRMGLHPVKDEERSSIIAGPYHTSFGFLVKASAALDEMERLLQADGSLSGKKLHLLLPENSAGEYIGPGGDNIRQIKNKFGLADVTYKTAAVSCPEITITEETWTE